MRSPRRLVLLFACLQALIAPWAAAELWVLSHGNGRVLGYDPEDGSPVSTLVEPVTTGFSFPGGIAIRPTDSRLYVASTLSGQIWSYLTTTGAVVSPPAASGLVAPGPLVFDAAGANLYFVADVQNGVETDSALRRLALPGGGVTTLASHPTASFAGIALRGSQVFLSDAVGGAILRYSTSGGNPTTIVSGLASPAGLLFTSSTTLLVAESASDRVTEYQEVAGAWSFVRTVLNPVSAVDGPYGLALGPDGRIAVSGAFSHDVVAVDPTTLEVETLIAAAGGVRVPGALAWQGSTLFVASRAGNVVRGFDAAGSPTGVVARGLTAPADAAIAATPGQTLLVASAAANQVVEFAATTGEIVRTLSNVCPISFTRPFSVAADATGRVYVSCPPIDGVRRFDATGLGVSFIAAGAGGLASPRDVALAPDGNVLVASSTGEVIEYSGTTGAFLGIFIDATGNGGGPIDPHALVFQGDGLFVTSYFPSEVVEYDAASGSFRGIRVASGAGGLSGPRGLAFHRSGDLLVASEGTDSVLRFNRQTGAYVGAFVPSGSAGLDQPYDLEMGTAPQAVPSLVPWSISGLLASLIALGVGRSKYARRSPGPGKGTCA